MILSPRYLVEPVMLLFMFTYIMQLIYYSGIYQADVWYDQTKNETLVRYVCLIFETIILILIILKISRFINSAPGVLATFKYW